jgi:hypothetical protein
VIVVGTNQEKNMKRRVMATSVNQDKNIEGGRRHAPKKITGKGRQ